MVEGWPPVRKWIALSVAGVLVLGLASGASAQIIKPKATVTSPDGKSIEEAQQESYDGPKARVAVSRFTDKTGKGWWTGQIGDGMADMLATALFHSNKFIVLERQTLGDVLKEQDLGSAGRIKKGTEAPVGEIEGAELLITGAVTEFEGAQSGGGGGLGGLGGLGTAGRRLRRHRGRHQERPHGHRHARDRHQDLAHRRGDQRRGEGDRLRPRRGAGRGGRRRRAGRGPGRLVEDADREGAPALPPGGGEVRRLEDPADLLPAQARRRGRPGGGRGAGRAGVDGAGQPRSGGTAVAAAPPSDATGTPSALKVLKSVRTDLDKQVVADLNEVTRRGVVLSVVVTLRGVGSGSHPHLILNKEKSHILNYDTGETTPMINADGFSYGQVNQGEVKTLRATFKVPKDAKKIGITLSGFGTFDDVNVE